MSKSLMKLVYLIMIIGLANCSMQNKSSNEVKDLYKGFQNPPTEAKPSAYYIMLNGYLNKEFAQKELEEYAAKGIGGLLVFDMGIIGVEEYFPPAGPKFMSDEWLDNFSYIVKTADKLGMTVELAAVSSWDMGGSWTKPEEAVLALYQNNITVTGPQKIKQELKYPELPETAILDKNGEPVISEEIALLAIPVKKRQTSYEFVFKLGYDTLHTLDHFVLTNAKNKNSQLANGENIFAKDFSIAVSEIDSKSSNFKEVLKGSLKANTKKQRFNIKETKAKYVRLRIYNGHNIESDLVQLAEFEVYANNGESLIHRPYNNRFDGGMMVRHNSQLGSEKKWRAKNINDGGYSGDVNTWVSNGKPPVLIEDVNTIQIITDKFKDGLLEWDVPEGEWEVIRYVMTNTGEKLKIPNPASDGLATDHLSANATKNHIKYLTTKLENKFGDLSKSSVSNFYLPSYEVRGLLWTYDMFEQFKKYRGYDLVKYLPALNGYVVENEETTDRFLYDYQKTMGDLLIDAFYITANETAREDGMAVKAESAGPGPPVHLVPVEALKALSVVDAMQGEFWPWREYWDALWVVKEVAASAHIYGRKEVHMEAFTGFRHWMDGPVDLKPSADRAFCEGMNHIVWHMAEHTPPEAGKPGWVYHAGSHLNVNLIWWEQMKPWMDYLARTSFLLQQGLFVGDVVYYYGDKGANFIPPKHTNTSLNDCYDYDVTNLEVMLNRMDVKNNKIVLPDGMSYEVLVLPEQEDITVVALQRIKELVNKGATVLGEKPIKSTGLYNYSESDAEVKKLADELWGNVNGTSVKENKYGKGKIISGKSINEVLADLGVTPDFQFASIEGNANLDYIHRRTNEEEIYFIRNEKDVVTKFKATFRVKNKTPELWLPDTGERITQLAYEVTDNEISFDMELDKMGSMFVVFTSNGNSEYIKAISEDNCVADIKSDTITIISNKNGEYKITTIENKEIKYSVDNVPSADVITGEWKISFLSKGWGAPESATTKKLKSISEFKNKEIKYYSGISRYENNVNISEDKLTHRNKVVLELGDLWLLADVTVNGKLLGTVWKAPYSVDITDAVKAGENKLQIDIANTWCNRLIGEAKGQTAQKLCKTNIDGNETTEADPWTEVPLRKSGLFGPVKIVYGVENRVELR
ncbi:MAG: glycosyl hydrolase [Bacteroidota bacterium]